MPHCRPAVGGTCVKRILGQGSASGYPQVSIALLTTLEAARFHGGRRGCGDRSVESSEQSSTAQHLPSGGSQRHRPRTRRVADPGVDPVAHVRFPEFAAATSLERGGKTYYFIAKETREQFEAKEKAAG